MADTKGEFVQRTAYSSFDNTISQSRYKNTTFLHSDAKFFSIVIHWTRRSVTTDGERI